MAWKRSSVRSRSGPPKQTILNPAAPGIHPIFIGICQPTSDAMNGFVLSGDERRRTELREHPGVTRLGSADASFASTAESVPEGSDFIHGRYLLVDVCGFSGHARRSMRA